MIDSLVKSLTSITGDHKLISIVVMYIIGLIVTLGIPKALAVPINAINAIVSKPIDAPNGINNEAIIGIVANMVNTIILEILVSQTFYSTISH
jgi:predicted histidine transporter YuiF (NhaC family)